MSAENVIQRKLMDLDATIIMIHMLCSFDILFTSFLKIHSAFNSTK